MSTATPTWRTLPDADLIDLSRTFDLQCSGCNVRLTHPDSIRSGFCSRCVPLPTKDADAPERRRGPNGEDQGYAAVPWAKAIDGELWAVASPDQIRKAEDILAWQEKYREVKVVCGEALESLRARKAKAAPKCRCGKPLVGTLATRRGECEDCQRKGDAVCWCWTDPAHAKARTFCHVCERTAREARKANESPAVKAMDVFEPDDAAIYEASMFAALEDDAAIYGESEGVDAVVAVAGRSLEYRMACNEIG